MASLSGSQSAIEKSGGMGGKGSAYQLLVNAMVRYVLGQDCCSSGDGLAGKEEDATRMKFMP